MIGLGRALTLESVTPDTIAQVRPRVGGRPGLVFRPNH